MSGTVVGGKKSARTIKKLYGADHWQRIGTIGGANGHTGGFYRDPALAAEAGRKGGYISSRTDIKNGQGKKHRAYIIPPKPSLLTRIRRALHV